MGSKPGIYDNSEVWECDKLKRSKPGLNLEAIAVTCGAFDRRGDGTGPVVSLDHREWEGVMLRGEWGTPVNGETSSRLTEGWTIFPSYH